MAIKSRKVTAKPKEITYEVSSPIVKSKHPAGGYDNMTTAVTVSDSGKIHVHRFSDVFYESATPQSLRAFIGILNEAISLSEKAFPQTK